MIRQWFVYLLVDPDTDEVRYVGKSANPEGRLKSHMRYKQSARLPVGLWARSLMSRCSAPTLRIYGACATESEAFALERLAVAEFRGGGARLLNQTDGGDGLSGHEFSASHRQALSTATTRHWQNPESREIQSAALRKACSSSDIRTARSSALKQKWADAAWRERMLAEMRSPEGRAKKAAAGKASWVGRDASQQIRNLWANPSCRKRILAGKRQAELRPEVREKRRAAANVRWNRQRQAEATS